MTWERWLSTQWDKRNSGVNLDTRHLQEGGDIPQIFIKAVLEGKKREQFPKNLIWKCLWTLKLRLRYQANMKKEEGSPVAWRALHHWAEPSSPDKCQSLCMPIHPCPPPSPLPRPICRKAGTYWFGCHLTSLSFVPANPSTSEENRQCTWPILAGHNSSLRVTRKKTRTQLNVHEACV